MLYTSYFVLVMYALFLSSAATCLFVHLEVSSPPQWCWQKNTESQSDIQLSCACYKAEEISVCLLWADMSMHVHTAFTQCMIELQTYVYVSVTFCSSPIRFRRFTIQPFSSISQCHKRVGLGNRTCLLQYCVSSAFVIQQVLQQWGQRTSVTYVPCTSPFTG